MTVELPAGSAPFASGRDADVYALDDRWVLRRYRDGKPVLDEAEYMRWVARYGYPVPDVREVAGPDLVMERVTGPTLAEAGAAGDVTPRGAGELHADLHRRLHAIPPPSGRPGRAVVHCDLHPENVILGADGPVVIDWRDAAEGEPEYDIALTAVILAQVALDPAYAELSDFLREALAVYLADSPDPSRALGAALDRRRRNPTLTEAERALLPAQETLIRSLLSGG